MSEYQDAIERNKIGNGKLIVLKHLGSLYGAGRTDFIKEMYPQLLKIKAALDDCFDRLNDSIFPVTNLNGKKQDNKILVEFRKIDKQYQALEQLIDNIYCSDLTKPIGKENSINTFLLLSPYIKDEVKGVN